MEVQGKSTETLILEAAEQEFLNKGFAGARTTSIAESAGVTHAMLHYYFRTKKKLFNSIIAKKFSMISEAIEKSIAYEPLSLKNTIRNIINSHLDFIAANPNLPRFLITELYNEPSRAEVITDKIKYYLSVIVARIQKLIDEGVAKGECRRVDANTLMLDIVSLNIFSYIATPMVNSVLDNCMADKEKFLESRKKNNYETIIRKLLP